MCSGCTALLGRHQLCCMHRSQTQEVEHAGQVCHRNFTQCFHQNAIVTRIALNTKDKLLLTPQGLGIRVCFLRHLIWYFASIVVECRKPKKYTWQPHIFLLVICRHLKVTFKKICMYVLCYHYFNA